MGQKSLKERIEEEMVVDYENVLDRNFGLANQFFNITKKGTVNIESEVKDETRIKLYLIGKTYAKHGGYSKTENVSNKELGIELGIPDNSVTRWLTKLRGENVIKSVGRGLHIIPLNKIERALRDVVKEVGENNG